MVFKLIINAKKQLKHTWSSPKSSLKIVGYRHKLPNAILKLGYFRNQLINIKKLLSLILVDWKDLNITQLVYGSYKNKSSLYIWQITRKKDPYTLQKLGSFLGIVFHFKNNMRQQ